MKDDRQKNLTIRIRKEISAARKRAWRNIKPFRCVLCGRKVMSVCDSHSVPQMVLRNIANNGKVLQANSLIGLEAINVESGVGDAGRFYYICNSCDSAFFQEYENADNLSREPTDKMMAEIALKNTLIQLYKRLLEKELMEDLQREYGAFENMDLPNAIWDLDKAEYDEQLDLYKSIVCEEKNGEFNILFWRLLPYKVPIAMQSSLVLHKDRSGDIVNNISDLSTNTRMQNMHMCVFPLAVQTAVLVFCHRREDGYACVKDQFDAASDEENLKYINWLVFKYTENYFLSKSLGQVVSSSAKLQELSREQAEYPNLGLVDSQVLLFGYTPVAMDEIPCLLDSEYAL